MGMKTTLKLINAIHFQNKCLFVLKKNILSFLCFFKKITKTPEK